MSDRAYVVCGPESSGNRWLASVLIAAGCEGFDTHHQPHEGGDVPLASEIDKPLVLIKHQRLNVWAQMLRAHDFKHLTAIMLLREEIATVQSQLANGHENDSQRARKTRAAKIAEAMRDACVCYDSVRVQTVEGLGLAALNLWLVDIGLSEISALDVDEAGLRNQSIEGNRKYYRALQSRELKKS